MKKIYDAPALELLAYCSLSPIGATTDDSFNSFNGLGVEEKDSQPWNSGELGWT